MGMLSSSSPENIASTPRDLAPCSDKSTTIASTKTWALLISSFAIIFLIEFHQALLVELTLELGILKNP